MNKEEIRKTAWESVGDEKLFPNHSDKDIWNNGFDACYNILSTTSQTHKAMSAEEILELHFGSDFWEVKKYLPNIVSAMQEYINQPIPVGGKSVEQIEGELYLWDGINGQLEEMDGMDDAKEYINEMFIDGNSIHPDIESVFILKKVARVYLEETGETKQIDGDDVPVCKLHIQPLSTQQPVSDGVEKGEWFSMDEHAQIMAIDFANWLLENVYSVNGCWYLNEGMSGEIYTTEHLYTIFKNRNQSSKK